MLTREPAGTRLRASPQGANWRFQVPKARLTKRAVDQIRPDPGGDVLLWDETLSGFGLRVKPSGVRSYVVQYRNPKGRSRRITLGRHGPLTPDAARRQALALLGEAALDGDPAALRETRRSAPTVDELATRYLEEHARPKKKPSSVKMDELNLRLHVRPRLGHRRVCDVNRADIARLHHEMRATPGAANRVLALIRKMLNLAECWGLRDDGSNPCRHVERYPERKLERFLDSEELTRLGAALERAEENGGAGPLAIAAIRLLLLTGARLSEILTLRWNYVDMERRALFLPDSKTGRKTIPLNAQALGVLSRLPRGSQWVFPGRNGNRLTTIRKTWERIRTAAKLDGVRLHDLRHSFASVGAATGVSLPIIGKLLGHTQAATTARYAHLADDAGRQATDLIGAQIAAALSGSPANTLPRSKPGAGGNLESSESSR